jgi:putative peptide zinc metalloprotease protein
LRRQRGRAYVTTLIFVSVIVLVLFVFPAPLWTLSEGVIWPAEQSQVRPATDGFVVKVLTSDGSVVKAGDALVQTQEPFLVARVAVLEAQFRELEAQLMAQQYKDRVQAAVIREEMEVARADLERARSRTDDLIIRAPLDGVFVLPNETDLTGRFLRQGEIVAYVVDPSQLTARIAVAQDEIGLVRQRTKGTQVMLADYGAEGYPVDVLREVPGGTTTLPTPALGTMGGGKVAVDPRDSEGRQTLARVFEFELGLPPEIDHAYLGARVYARFDHGSEALAFQMYRALRQLLLRQFGV